MMQSSHYILLQSQESEFFPSSRKPQFLDAADRIDEISVAGTRVVCASKASTGEIKRRDHRHRIQLNLVASMLGSFYQAGLRGRFLEFSRSRPPLTPPVKGGEPIPLPWWEGLGEGEARAGSEGPSSGNYWLDGKRDNETYLSRLKLCHDALGKPVLYIGEALGPSVSFSYSSGTAWGAICDEGLQCGIDYARPEEFYPNYPLGRAFGEEELIRAKAAISGDSGETAAALWSAKEAAVKAIGCGFHLIDPLQVSIMPANIRTDGFEGHAVVDEKACNRMPLPARIFPVRTFRNGPGWFSVAAIPASED